MEPKRTRRRSGPGGKRKGAKRRGRGAAAERDASVGGDARLAFFETAREYTRYLGVASDEGAFVVSTSSEKLGKHLFYKESRPEFRVLRRAVTAINALIGQGGRLFIDVGANIGTSTIAALRSHPFDSAVCCEPEPENYRLLGANLALNDLDHVQRFRVAVSSDPGSAHLVVLGGPPGKTWVATDPQQIRDKEAMREERLADDPSVELPEMRVSEIELVTLDGLVESGAIDPDQAGMLWIDVEGHEGHVLAGATKLTDRGLPIVLEFDPDALERRGDRGTIHDVAERSYTHFVDLRRQDADGTGPRFGLRSVADFSQFADRLLDSGRFTDLLLLRLDAGQARVGADLPELMRQRKADTEPDDR